MYIVQLFKIEAYKQYIRVTSYSQQYNNSSHICIYYVGDADADAQIIYSFIRYSYNHNITKFYIINGNIFSRVNNIISIVDIDLICLLFFTYIYIYASSIYCI